MAGKKLFTKTRIINLIVFSLFFVAFSVLYFIVPTDVYKGEFISDSYFVNLINDNRAYFIGFFETNSFYGKFLNNILIYANVTNHSYSLTFIKVASYIVTTLTFIVGYALFWNVETKGKRHLLSLLFFLFIGLNLTNVYDACSLIDVKILILVSLLSIFLIQLSKKYENEIVKTVLFSVAAFIQVFAFFLPIACVFVYLIIKNDTKDKVLKIINYAVPSSVLAIAIGLNFRIFGAFSFNNNFDPVLFFSSFVMPINRIVPTDYADTFNLVCSIVGMVIFAVIVINELIHKRFYSLSLLLFVISLEMFSYQRYGYYLSKLFQLNSIIFGYFIYRLINDEKPSFAFLAKLQGKFFGKVKTRTVDAGTTIKTVMPLLMVFTYLVSGGVAASILLENNDVRKNSDEVLGYIKNYDDGYLDDEASYYFDVDKKDFDKTLNPYLEGGYISYKENPLEKDEEKDNLQNVVFHRGARRDDLKMYWLSDNFSFETYCSNRYLRLSLFSIVDSSDLTIYCNNQYVGVYHIGKDSNCVDFDMKQYMGKQVVIRGNFTKTTHGPFEGDGKYACEITHLGFSNRYGVYDPALDNSLWCNKEVGFYYPEINTNKMYSFYIPGSQGSSCNIYVNDTLIKNYELKSGANEIMLNMVPFYGKEANVKFIFENKLSVVVDNKPIYCKYDGEVSSKNYGLYPADNDGSIWCNNDFTFYYDEEKYTGDTRFRTFKFYVPAGTKENLTHIYVNDTHVKDVILYQGLNEVSVDLFAFKNQFLNIRFAMDDYIHSKYDNRQKTCLYQGVIDSDSYGIYSARNGEDKWCSKEFGFYFRNFVNEDIYSRFTFYMPSGAEPNPLKVFINGTLARETSFFGGFNEVALDLASYEGKDVLITFEFENSLPTNVNDLRVRTCVYNGLRKTNSYGINDADSWCAKEFGFFYKNLQTNGRYRKYSLYNPLNRLNKVKCYINGTVFNEYELRPGSNELVLDLLTYQGLDVGIKFELDSQIFSSLTNHEFVVMYQGYSDGNYYGLKSDSPSTPDNWCKKEFAFYYENLVTSGRYRTYKFYVPLGTSDNPLKVYINNNLALSSKLVAGMNEVVIDFYQYQETDVVLKFVLDNSLPDATNDKRERTCIYQGFVESNDYGFNSAPAGESPWCKKEFAFNFENLQMTKKYRLFNFYVPVGTPENPFNAYINGNLVLTSKMVEGTNEIEFDLSSYQGMDVEIKFVLTNSLPTDGNDKRERTCLYLGYKDSDEFGFYPASSGDPIWCKKTFVFNFDNLSSQGRYRSFKFYVPVGAVDNPLKVYANNTLILTSALKAGLNQVELDLYSYQGIDVEFKFVLDNGLPTNGSDKRERTCIYQGYSDSNSYGIHPANAGENPWCKKEFAFHYSSLETTTRYRRFFFYLPENVIDNPYKVYVNNNLVKTGSAHGGDNEIAIDVSNYVGMDIEVKFIFDNEVGSPNDFRELSCIYEGFTDAETFGFYDNDSAGTIFGKKNFGFTFNNVQSNKSFSFYMPDSVPDNPIKAYVNGTLVYSGVLVGGMNSIELDLSSYQGMNIGVTFEVTNRINSGNDSRELTCVFSGVIDVSFGTGN